MVGTISILLCLATLQEKTGLERVRTENVEEIPSRHKRSEPYIREVASFSDIMGVLENTLVAEEGLKQPHEPCGLEVDSGNTDDGFRCGECNGEFSVDWVEQKVTWER